LQSGNLLLLKINFSSPPPLAPTRQDRQHPRKERGRLIRVLLEFRLQPGANESKIKQENFENTPQPVPQQAEA
jgi:hypothetical protein